MADKRKRRFTAREEIKETAAGSSFSNFAPLVIYHVSFFIFITTIGLNIIFGIIVDTFSELRDLKWRAESDMKDTCFICSRNSYDFEHHGKGFDHHVKQEHNMWAYVYFIIHLDDIKTSDYTALELYVAKLMEKENYEFIPLNRALCLSSIDIDSTESKIDDLLSQVNNIAKKQREEEAEKKRKVEKLKQKRWQEKHRGLVYGQNDYDPEREPLLHSREPSIARSMNNSPAPQQLLRSVLTNQATMSYPGSPQHHPDQLHPPPTLPGRPTRPTLKLQRKQECDDFDVDSVTDSDCSSHHRGGSFDLLDDDTPSTLPTHPPFPLPAQESSADTTSPSSSCYQEAISLPPPPPPISPPAVVLLPPGSRPFDDPPPPRGQDSPDDGPPPPSSSL